MGNKQRKTFLEQQLIEELKPFLDKENSAETRKQIQITIESVLSKAKDGYSVIMEENN